MTRKHKEGDHIMVKVELTEEQLQFRKFRQRKIKEAFMAMPLSEYWELKFMPPLTGTDKKLYHTAVMHPKKDAEFCLSGFLKLVRKKLKGNACNNMLMMMWAMKISEESLKNGLYALYMPAGMYMDYPTVLLGSSRMLPDMKVKKAPEKAEPVTVVIHGAPFPKK